MSIKKNHVIVLAAAAGLLLQDIPANAQLEEVIVTARKREESILKVPVVLTVLDQSRIEQYATTDLFQITERVPGLQFSQGTLSFGAQISLRGVGTGTLNTTLDQSVALNIDGMQMTQGLAYSAGMFDMAQVEVLKGPQALFFGKAAPGGVISIRTADPGDDLELIARHGYEVDAEENRTELIVSGPVSDTLSLRLATAYSDRQGYLKNKAIGLPETGSRDPAERDFAPREQWLIRGTVLWEPNDRFSSRLKLNRMESDLDGDGGGTQLSSCPDGIRAPSGTPFIGGGEDCRYDDVIRIVDLDPAAFVGIRNGGTPFNEVDQDFGTLELNYQVSDGLTLTSVTGYYDLDNSAMINATNTTYAAPVIAPDADFEREDFTQELRLTSDYSDSALNFMVGAFYQDGKMTYHNNLLSNTAFGLPPLLDKGYQDITIDAFSLFGQLIWTVTPELELAGGVRWTDEQREHTAIQTITGTPIPVPTATPKLSEDDFSPEFTLTWTPRDNLTVFGSVKKAFKSGSYDTVTIPAPGEEVSFGDEQVRGGELGLKSLLLDGRMNLNVAGYYYEFDDLQVGANQTSESGQIDIRTLNAASSEVYGVDFDVTYLPMSVEGLVLSAGVNYNKAEYKDFENSQCWGGQRIQDGCDRLLDPRTGLYTAQDLSGKEMLRAPEWQGTVGADYERKLGSGMTLALGWYTSYSDKYFTNVLLRDDMVQDSYFTHNASIALRGADDTWEVALIGNNLSDELVAGNCVNFNGENGVIFGGVVTGGSESGPAGVEELICDVTSNRSIWLRVSYNFSELVGR